LAFFSVLVQARAEAAGAGGSGAGEIDEPTLRAFAKSARPYHASVTGTSRDWSARISVDAAGAADGAALGVALMLLLAKQASLPEWPVIRVEAVREDVLVEEIADFAGLDGQAATDLPDA
jgi:hypothetical protein